MNQNLRGIRRQPRQSAENRLLSGAAPLDPMHRFGGTLHQGKNRAAIHLLAHHTNPADPLGGQSRLQRPGDHRPASQRQQQLVAICAHAATTASCRNQQMHKRLLLQAG